MFASRQPGGSERIAGFINSSSRWRTSQRCGLEAREPTSAANLNTSTVWQTGRREQRRSSFFGLTARPDAHVAPSGQRVLSPAPRRLA